MDEYSRIREFDSPGFITGKPLVLGGSAGRESSTANGITMVTKEAVKVAGLKIEDSKIIIQGFGNSGSFLAKFLHDEGAKIVKVSDAYGALYDPGGLDINYLLDQRDSFGTITSLFSNKELLIKPCDILIPAALENQITEENAPDIQARLLVEAVNGPTTLKATGILGH